MTTSSPTSSRPMGENTAELTAVAEATRERPPIAPTASGADSDLVLIPAARLADLGQVLDDVADLARRWQENAADAAASAGPWLFGARANGWADALDAAAHELRATVRFAARSATSSDVVPTPRASSKAAVIDAVSAAIKAHGELPPAVRSSRTTRLPFEAAQAAINVVAPAAHDAAIQRARGLLLDHGHREAAALLRSLEENR